MPPGPQQNFGALQPGKQESNVFFKVLVVVIATSARANVCACKKRLQPGLSRATRVSSRVTPKLVSCPVSPERVRQPRGAGPGNIAMSLQVLSNIVIPVRVPGARWALSAVSRLMQLLKPTVISLSCLLPPPWRGCGGTLAQLGKTSPWLPPKQMAARKVQK